MPPQQATARLHNEVEMQAETEDDYEPYGDPEDWKCWYCHGEGWGIVGTDWDCTDGVNGPYDGETEQCPNCHGTGKADDCTFW